jgi:tripartite-type tricarboxylate transporter receptor subunit TctC
MTHVPYRGGAPAVSDLVAGQVQVMFDVLATSLPFIETGKVRALAVTTSARSQSLPNVPSVADTVSGTELSAWAGIGAPRGTSCDIVERLNEEINAGLADATIKGRIAELGATPFPSSSAEFRKLITQETEKWGRVIRAAQIKAE